MCVWQQAAAMHSTTSLCERQQVATLMLQCIATDRDFQLDNWEKGNQRYASLDRQQEAAQIRGDATKCLVEMIERSGGVRM